MKNAILLLVLAVAAVAPATAGWALNFVDQVKMNPGIIYDFYYGYEDNIC